jgi:hypothetical protein
LVKWTRNSSRLWWFIKHHQTKHFKNGYVWIMLWISLNWDP